MGAFEDLHHDRIVGSLAMFDRMIFKGHLTKLFYPGAVSAFLWAQGFPMTEFTRYAQSTTEQITANAKALAEKIATTAIARKLLARAYHLLVESKAMAEATAAPAIAPSGRRPSRRPKATKSRVSSQNRMGRPPSRAR